MKEKNKHNTQKRNQRLLWQRQNQGYAEGTGQKFTHHEHEEHGYFGNLGVLIISLNFFFFLFLSFFGGKEAYIFEGFKKEELDVQVWGEAKEFGGSLPTSLFHPLWNVPLPQAAWKKKSEHNLLIYSSDLLYLSQIAHHCLVWP